MSFYSNGGWGYGAQGATQNASFYGVHQPPPYPPAPFNMSMQNLGSFYDNGMQRPNSFYADDALASATPSRPPSPTMDATMPAASTSRSTSTAEGDAVAAYAGLEGVNAPSFYAAAAAAASSTRTTPTTSAAPTPVPGVGDRRGDDTPPPLQRQNSSGRLLRRKVSFSGIPSKLPPEVETPKTSPTLKRKGSRRLSYSPSNLREEVQNRQIETPGQQQPQEEIEVQELPPEEPQPLQQPQPQPQLPLPQQQQQLPQRPQQWPSMFQQQWQQQQQFRQQQWQRQQQQQRQQQFSVQQQQQQQQWQPQGQTTETQAVSELNYFYATELEEPAPQPQEETELPEGQPQQPDAAEEQSAQPLSDPQQPTLSTSGPANSSQRHSFYRRNSQSMMMMAPYNPNGYGPFMQNYGVPPFTRPMCPPPYNVFRGMPYGGVYNANAMMYQRPVMTNYF